MKEDPFKVYGNYHRRDPNLPALPTPQGVFISEDPYAHNPRVIYDESSPVPTAAKLKAIREMFAKRFNVQGTMSGRMVGSRAAGPVEIKKSKAPDATSG